MFSVQVRSFVVYFCLNIEFVVFVCADGMH